MEKYLVTETRRYEVSANSLADAQFVWRRFETHSEFEDDVEYLDGVSVVEEADTTSGNAYQNAIKTLVDTADYYYSMYGAEVEEDTYWFEKWLTALDLLERAQGLQEGSLYEQHLEKCSVCMDVN